MTALKDRLYESALRLLPIRLRVALLFWRRRGYWPDLSRPRLFTERLAAMKAVPPTPLMTVCADKLAVKPLVRERCGSDMVTPTLWEGRELPGQAELEGMIPFVLKANHATAMTEIITDPAQLDREALALTTDRWLETGMPVVTSEHWYDYIDRKLLIEPWLGPDLKDFKVYVFSGRPELIQVDSDRFGTHTRAFFNCDWERRHFRLIYPETEGDVPPPRHLQAILAAAGELGEPFDFARVDFYDLEDGPRFGEITFAPEGGLGVFEPASADVMLGDLWQSANAARRGSSPGN